MVSSPQFLANLVFLLYVLFLLLSFSFSLSLFSLFLLLFLKYSSKSAILSFSRIARISFLTISISMALNFHKCRTIDVLRRVGSFDSVAMELLFGFY